MIASRTEGEEGLNSRDVRKSWTKKAYSLGTWLHFLPSKLVMPAVPNLPTHSASSWAVVLVPAGYGSGTISPRLVAVR